MSYKISGRCSHDNSEHQKQATLVKMVQLGDDYLPEIYHVSFDLQLCTSIQL